MKLTYDYTGVNETSKPTLTLFFFNATDLGQDMKMIYLKWAQPFA